MAACQNASMTPANETKQPIAMPSSGPCPWVSASTKPHTPAIKDWMAITDPMPNATLGASIRVAAAATALASVTSATTVAQPRAAAPIGACTQGRAAWKTNAPTASAGHATPRTATRRRVSQPGP